MWRTIARANLIAGTARRLVGAGSYLTSKGVELKRTHEAKSKRDDVKVRWVQILEQKGTQLFFDPRRKQFLVDPSGKLHTNLKRVDMLDVHKKTDERQKLILMKFPGFKSFVDHFDNHITWTVKDGEIVPEVKS